MDYQNSRNFQMNVSNQPSFEDTTNCHSDGFQMVVRSNEWLQTATGSQSAIQQTFINENSNQQELYCNINQQTSYHLCYQHQRYEHYEESAVNNQPLSQLRSEGSKPLFSREDICVNRSVSPKKKPISRASSSDYSSPEDRNRHQRNSSKSKQTTSRKKTPSPEKVPYFLDQAREKDRIKRVYGSRKSRSLSPVYNRRRPGKPRSRSRTPPSYRRRKSYERRSPSRDRHRARYRSNYGSRSRSRSRERRRTPLSRRKEDERQSMSLQPALAPPVTQYIPIPVPVEYPYMQPSWGGPMMPPQPRFPYPMRPAMPPPMPYMLRPQRPPRYLQNAYQRGHFRPRQY